MENSRATMTKISSVRSVDCFRRKVAFSRELVARRVGRRSDLSLERRIVGMMPGGLIDEDFTCSMKLK